MKRFIRVIIGAGIILAAVAFSAILWITRPEAAQKEELITLPVVEYMAVNFGEASFELPSQGIVEADRRTRLSAEVAGKVIEVSPAFESGEQLSEGDMLIQIDPTNYEAAVAQAASSIADAEANLASEEAKAAQAMRDWRKMGKSGEPTALLARKPQLKSATARVASTKASLAKAENDLARATIRAPYDCVISMTSTELGSYLAPGAIVAEVYATSPYEVRLPLSVDDAAFLPGAFQGKPGGNAEIRAQAAGQVRRWEAKIVRSEGEINRETRSLYLVAEIGEALESEGIEIRPGLYVDASIQSRPIPDVAKIPFRAFRNLNEVVIITDEDEIDFRKVSVLHRQGDFVYVNEGLKEGERVSLTELPDFIAGMKVAPQPAKVATTQPATTIAE